MIARCVFLFSSLSLLILSGCGAGPGAWCEPLVEGVEVVANTGPDAWVDRADSPDGEPHLTELWRVGGTNPDEELGQPVGLVVSPSGRVAVPDFILGSVTVIDADGTWLGEWTQPGEGPGETSLAVAAAWEDDERLAVFDLMAPKVVFVGPDGPVGEDQRVDPSVTVPVINTGEVHGAGMMADGTVFLQSGPAEIGSADAVGSVESERIAAALAVRPGAAEADTLARAIVDVLGTDPAPGWVAPGSNRLSVGVGTTGYAITGQSREYNVLVLDADGEPVRQVCRDASALPLRGDERGHGLEAEFGRVSEALRSTTPLDPPAAIGRVFLDRDGRLWVQRDRTGPADNPLYGAPGGSYDVFADDGRYSGTVHASESTHFMAAAGDTVWALEFGEYDEAWVVAYEMGW